MTDRMPGRASPSWCPVCHAPPGPDCPDRGKSPRQVRRALQRDLAREIAESQTGGVR
jgi:hypothetical protein